MQVCRSAWPRVGGLEASVGGLSRALVARGHRVRVVTLRDPEVEGRGDRADRADRADPADCDRAGTGRDPRAGIEVHETVADGIEVVRLPRVGPRRYPFAAGLVDAVRGADLVHVHGLDGLLDTLVARRAAVQAPIGISTHGGYFHRPRHPLLKRLCLRTLTRWSLARADAVWFTSEADRDRLAPARADGGVMPDGVDVARFARVVRRPEAGLVVVLGRVDVHKGLDDLVDALPHAPTARVEVVGREERPGLVDRLTARARRLGVADRIGFLGELGGEALLHLLGRADRVALPSRYEGFGIAAIEGMAARVPVVLSDIPAFRGHAGCASIVSFRDPRAAAEALVAPVPDGQVARGEQRAATFSWPSRAAAWELEYERVVRS